MSLIPGDDRAVSEVLGAVLVFALVLTLLVIVQSVAVPAANGQIEFEHSQRVQGDVGQLDRSVGDVATTGATGSVSIEAGTRYPSRFFLLNPAPAAGSLSTNESSFAVRNAVATNGETNDFWDGSERSYESRSIVYRPGYNHYTNAPDVAYEHGIVSRQFENRTLLADENTVVSGVASASWRSTAISRRRPRTRSSCRHVPSARPPRR